MKLKGPECAQSLPFVSVLNHHQYAQEVSFEPLREQTDRSSKLIKKFQNSNNSRETNFILFLKIEVMYDDKPLSPDFTLLDIAYIYAWRRVSFLFSNKKKNNPRKMTCKLVFFFFVMLKDSTYATFLSLHNEASRAASHDRLDASVVSDRQQNESDHAE